MDYYWELTLFDNTKIQIPPKAVEAIKTRWRAGELINLPNQSIPSHQIKGFEKTGRRYNDQKLIADVARAFNEPIINETGGVETQWVKCDVPNQLYTKKYAPLQFYHRLGELNGMVTMAYRQPTHQIDPDTVQLCTANEIIKLDNKLTT